MPPLMRVEVPDAARAASLLQEIEPLAGEAVGTRRRWEVRIPGTEQPRRSLVEGLNAVQRWLTSQQMRATTVHVDGRPYRIDAGLWSAPPRAERIERRRRARRATDAVDGGATSTTHL